MRKLILKIIAHPIVFLVTMALVWTLAQTYQIGGLSRQYIDVALGAAILLGIIFGYWAILVIALCEYVTTTVSDRFDALTIYIQLVLLAALIGWAINDFIGGPPLIYTGQGVALSGPPLAIVILAYALRGWFRTRSGS